MRMFSDCGLIFSGLAFKLSLVPFHLWTADTYQGAPTAVSGLLSAISKGAAAFALLTILYKVFGQMATLWNIMLAIVIVVTITVGNLFAMRQKNMKRFMAFSSISQAGYIMLAILGSPQQGTASLVYYIFFLALINTVISLYYYLLVVKAMFIDGNDNPIPCFKSDTSMRISLVICLTGILLLGIAGCVYRFFFNMAIIP